MAGPITWRNIQSNLGGANQLLLGGQQQMQQGFNTLQNLLKDNSKEDAQNREALKAFNTNQYLDQVAATDPAALATPEGQAALAQARQQYGTLIDQGATRGAVEQRLGQVQNLAINQGKFDDFTTERGQRDLIDTAYGLAAAGDQAGVDKLLTDNQFLNEGALRKELSGTFDAQRQRELRESAEGRAQRGEARSAASHALSMESGRENLNFAKASHGEAIRKMGEDRLADSLAVNFNEDFKSATEAQNALVAEVARENNLTVKADGSIDLSKADQDTQDNVANALRDAGAGNNSLTALRQRLVAEARNQNLSPAATKSALDRLDTVRTFDGLAAEDQAKVQNDISAATVDLRATEKKLTEQFNRKSKDNPFLTPSNDVTADSNKIVEAAAKKHDSEWFSTDINKTSLGREAVDLMQNGISLTIDGEDVEGVVPPSIIERAVLENGANKFLAEGGTVRTLVENYIKENKGIQKQISESQNLTEQFQKDIGKLNAEKLKIENSVTRARKAEKGVTVSNNDWVDALISNRSKR